MTPRRVLFTMASFVVVVVIVAIAAMRSNGPVRASFAPDAYQVSEAEDTNPDPNVFETTLTAQAAAVDIGGDLLASVLTFNGVLPGPQLRVNVGDTVIVHFRNNIAHATGIHWHGIQVPNASDGTPLTQDQVPPGGSFLYRFTANRPGIYWYHPHHHSSTNQVFKGLYGSLIVTDPNEAALVSSGTLPPESETKTLVFSDLTVCKAPGSNDLVTYDPTLPFVGGGALPVQPGPTPKELCETAPLDEDGNPRGAYAAGEVPNIQRGGHSGRVNEGQTVTTNGVNVGARAGSPSAPGTLSPTASVLDVRAGQGLRLQMINAAAVRFMRLRLTTSTGAMVPLVRVGGQGGLLDYAVIEGGNVAGFDFKYDSGQVLLDPGDRADVVAVIPAAASGVLTLWAEDFSRTGLGFARIPSVPIAHFKVTGPAETPYAIAAGTPLRAATGNLVPAFGAATLTLLDPAAFAAPKPGLATQNISLTNTAHGLGINGITGAHETLLDYTHAERPDSSRYAAMVALGSTLELTVENLTQAHHPFHLHGFQVQPIDLTRPGNPTYTFPYRETKDTVDVPPQYTLRYRVRIADRPLMDGTTLGGALGRWVFHCHIFPHAVFGMISEFNVVDSSGNERPHVNSNSTRVQGPGSFSMGGTYFDRDGDAVTLSASSGSIVVNDAAHWTWTRSAGPSSPVYVTATDSHGLKDQITFDVVNLCETPIVVGPASLAGGLVGTAYSTTLTQTGAIAPASFAVSTGVLPPGMSLSSSGVLSGTPTTAGAYVFTVTVTDGNSCAGSRTYTLVIACPLLAVSPPLLPSAPIGRPYSQTLTAAGAVATPAFSVVSGTLPAGLTLSAAGALTGIPSTRQRATFTVAVAGGGACTAERAYTLDVNADRVIVTGAGIGGAPVVRTLGIDGSPAAGPLANFSAVSAAFTGGVRVAAGDVTGDGVADVIVAPASGSALVRIFDGVSGAIFREATAYATAPADGVHVAVADINADGALDVITGAGSGVPLVRVFDVRSGSVLLEFVADSTRAAGARVAAGDLDGDVFPEIVTSAGAGAEPIVRVFSSSGGARGSFVAFDPAFRGGVNVALGDVNGDGVAEIVTAPGAGGAPHVRVWDARSQSELRGFFAYSATFAGGVNVAVGDLNGDGNAEVITATGSGTPQVRVWDPIRGAEIGSFNPSVGSPAGGAFVTAPVPRRVLVVDAPQPNTIVTQPLTIAGWALTEGAPVGSTGVSVVQAWAFPAGRFVPVLVGSTETKNLRSDVAALFGGQYAPSGFRFSAATLSPGTYDLAVVAFDQRTGAISQYRVVRIRVP